MSKTKTSKRKKVAMLLTITGPAGSGKTTIMLQIANLLTSCGFEVSGLTEGHQSQSMTITK